MSHTLGASTSPRMSSAHLTSPNAIPPRTSSTGGLSQAPTKPVLQPLPESSWLSNRHTSTSTITPSSGLATSTSTNGPAPDPLRYAATTWSPAKESILLGPYTYLFSHPGKDIRAQLISAFNAWLCVPPAALEIITRVVGMLHTASLLVDDVEDSSMLRRGLPVAHSIFGTAQTINSANYVYFEALQELLKLDELKDRAEGVSGRRRGEAVRIYTEELVNLHRGQGMDLFWRDTLTVPSEEDYLEMVGNKTGGLFRLAVRLMQAESASDRDCVPLVSLIGTIFQIRDDYLNLLSPSYSTNKGLCEDLTEGKFSFPIIHALRADPTNLVLLNILKQKTTDDEVKRYAVGYMQARGSFGYCKEVVERLVGRARTLVKELDRGEGRAEGVERILGGLGIE